MQVLGKFTNKTPSGAKTVECKLQFKRVNKKNVEM